MQNIRSHIQKKDIVEAIMLIAAVVLTIILNKTSFFDLCCIYILILLVYLIVHRDKYSILNDKGNISIVMLIWSIYAKIQTYGILFMTLIYPKLFPMCITIMGGIYLAYWITIICKKARKEIFNTIIYVIPIIVSFFFL